MVTNAHTGLLILGNQLFPRSHLAGLRGASVFMAEDDGLCTYVRHHKQKIVFTLAAMRHYADGLRRAGFRVTYRALDPKQALGTGPSFEEKLTAFVERYEIKRLVHFEIEDAFFEQRIESLVLALGLERTVLKSPMFLTDRDAAELFLRRQAHPRMVNFYRWQRQNLGLLLDENGGPLGGKWSHDEANRKPLPNDVVVPVDARTAPTQHVLDLLPLVADRFAKHPGELSRGSWWLPVTRPDALTWFSRFLTERLASFGAYEDAMTSRSATVFHGVLSPLMNAGLLTPAEIVDEAIAFSQQHKVPLNSTEGFIRQVVGWREFVRAVYRKHGAWQTQQNHFGHQRELTSAWYEGRTGIPPLDDLIRKAQRLGWAHHIERLMVAGNIMTLAEIHPQSAYRWFMEMFVDSSDWVMVPNVFGMALFADGGLMTTKPYICGSSYILRMSDYEAPRELSDQTQWVDVLDGLFWRFVDRQRATIGANLRTAMMLKAFANLKAERKVRIFAAADGFLQRYTRAVSVA